MVCLFRVLLNSHHRDTDLPAIASRSGEAGGVHGEIFIQLVEQKGCHVPKIRNIYNYLKLYKIKISDFVQENMMY